MAEIKIEKKKPIWPWIVALVLVLGLVYFIFLKDNDMQVQNTTEIENTTSVDTMNTTSIDTTKTTSIDTTAN